MFNPDYTARGIRETEVRTIREFLEHHRDDLTGVVLDYGSGRQPYRSLISGYGRYLAWDRPDFPGAIEGVEGTGPAFEADKHKEMIDTVVCTQVIQYVDNPGWLLARIDDWLKPGGVLLMTGPGNWPEVEPNDIIRYTRSGIEHVLTVGRWDDVVVHSRHGIEVNDIRMSLGWAARAVKPS